MLKELDNLDFKILKRMDNPVYAGQLMREIGCYIQPIAKHMKVLVDEGLIEFYYKKGPRKFYRRTPEGQVFFEVYSRLLWSLKKTKNDKKHNRRGLKDDEI